MNRIVARENAMKLIYEWMMGGDGGYDTLTGILEIQPDEEEADFMNLLFSGVKANLDTLNEKIESKLDKSWRIDRISRVDYAILLIAVYELTYTDTGESIIINEAVSMANKFSGDKAGTFVNGVLGSIVRSKTDA